MANRRTLFDKPTASKTTTYNYDTLGEVTRLSKGKERNFTLVLDYLIRKGIEHSKEEELDSLEGRK